MTIGRLAPVYQGRIMLPVLGKVTATRYTDRVQVQLVSGQSAADFATRAENLAHGFGAMLCRVRTAVPGALVLEFVRRDALAAVIPALPPPAHVDLRALPVGRREHTPTRDHPFTVILVDEVAFLTAYQRDSKLRDRVKAALATLTTQGRAVGYCVIAALQDPRKEVMSIRNLFPDRIAMRLDEPEQVDMVLGDGARDRGATADLISTDPATGAGVAYVRLATDPDPVRVRAAWVTDADIAAMCDQCAATPGLRPIEGGAAA